MNKKLIILILGILVVGTVFALTFENEDALYTYEKKIFQNKKAQIEIVDVIKKSYSNEIEVYWRVRVWEEIPYEATVCDCIDEECFEMSCENVTRTRQEDILIDSLSSKFPEDTTEIEIGKTIKKHAKDYLKIWKKSHFIREKEELIGQKYTISLEI